MSTQSSPRPAFLSLPPELRNSIYELVLEQPQMVIRAGPARGVEKDDPPVLRTVHSLLCVCRQIRLEVFGLIPAIESVVLILAGFNTKKFDIWLRIMRTERVRQIRRIVFNRIICAKCLMSSMPAKGMPGRWVDCQRTVSLNFGAQPQNIEGAEGRSKYPPGTYGHANIIVKEDSNFCSHGKKAAIDRRISSTKVPQAHRLDYHNWDYAANITALEDIWTIAGM